LFEFYLLNFVRVMRFLRGFTSSAAKTQKVN